MNLFWTVAWASLEYGIMPLDNSSFYKVIDGSRNVFVRIDRSYPMGDQHEKYAQFARTVAASSTDLLVTTIGVSALADGMNQDLAAHFSLTQPGGRMSHADIDAKLPRFYLFPKGVAGRTVLAAKRFDRDLSADALVRFVTRHNVVVPAPGTVPALHLLADNFAAAGKAEQEARIAKARLLLEELAGPERSAGEYYVRCMERVVSGGSAWVDAELGRIRTLQRDAVSDQKRDEFKRRVNVLLAFEVTGASEL